MYKINEVSKISGVTIRMLHHYDKIGLLTPSERNNSNYRLYNQDDINRLHQILIYKELDFPLKEIKKILDEPNIDKQKILKEQRELLIVRKNRLDMIIKSIDETITHKGDKTMNKEKFKPFTYEQVKNHEKEYEQETKQKHQDTQTYSQSKSKTSKYTKQDWENIMSEANSIYIELSQNMDKSPDDKEVQTIIEKWRNHITKYYYDCSVEIFRGLGQMYVYDERFTKNIDKYGKGLAQFLSDGIEIYCNNQK